MKKFATAVGLAVLAGGAALVAWWLFPGNRCHIKAALVPQYQVTKGGTHAGKDGTSPFFRDQVVFHPASGKPRSGQRKAAVSMEEDGDGTATSNSNVPVVPGRELAPETKARLNCGVSAVEREALRALIHSGRKDALAAALGKLLAVSADSPDLKDYKAIFADCRDPEIAAWLADFMGKTQLADVRDRVLSILAEIRSAEVIAALVEKKKHPRDTLHGEDCAKAVASCRDPSQVQPLKSLLDHEEDETLQKAAASALANIGNAEACGILIEKASASDAIAQYCREALAGVSSSYGQEALIGAAADSSVPVDVRVAVIRALSVQNSVRVQAALKNLNSGSEDPVIRVEVAKILEETAVSTEVQGRESKTAQGGALVETCF